MMKLEMKYQLPPACRLTSQPFVLFLFQAPPDVMWAPPSNTVTRLSGGMLVTLSQEPHYCVWEAGPGPWLWHPDMLFAS